MNTADLEAADVSAVALRFHALEIGDAVEVELLVTDTGQGHPRMVEGTVIAATPLALIVETRTGGRRTARIPWAAVALIRDGLTEHPGL